MAVKLKYYNGRNEMRLSRVKLFKKTGKKIPSLNSFQANYLKGYYTLKEQYYLIRFLKS